MGNRLLDLDLPQPPAWARVSQEQFAEALARLPGDLRVVFELHALRGQSYGEIADAPARREGRRGEPTACARVPCSKGPSWIGRPRSRDAHLRQAARVRGRRAARRRIPDFERHLVGCASCQTELQDVMLLEALGQGMVDGTVPGAATHPKVVTRARAMRWAVAAGAAAAVAAICTAWRWRVRGTRGDAR
jgi:hypothetical protein